MMGVSDELNGGEEEILFCSEVLNHININDGKVSFIPNISLRNPGENLKVRPLTTLDYDKGFIQLLSQLTNVGDVTKEMFLERFYSMKECKDSYYIIVVEDISTGQVVGSVSVVIEQKFIHSVGKRARLEDLVVDDNYRGKQLGKLLVQTAHLLARHLSCYKINLDCKDPMLKFYSQMGFVAEPGNSNTMTIRF